MQADAKAPTPRRTIPIRKIGERRLTKEKSCNSDTARTGTPSLEWHGLRLKAASISPVFLRMVAATVGAVATAMANVALGRVAPAEVNLGVGDAAPDFALPGSDGRTYRLGDYRGRQAVVLAWFPKAFTGGCTAECRSLGADAALSACNVQSLCGECGLARRQRRVCARARSRVSDFE